MDKRRIQNLEFRIKKGRVLVANFFFAIYHSGFRLLLLTLSAGVLVSCSTTRPDLVWNENGRQYGKASWYDDHGDRTANGEIYNMYALTAAHPSLALNSIVEVANLQNGKKITVRVNDRLPPIHEGRVIDLSKAAFRKLSSLEDGLIEVEVRVIQYGNNRYQKADRSAPSGKMFLVKNKVSSSNAKIAKNTKPL